MECLSFCVGNSIDLSRLDTFYKSDTGIGLSSRTREVIRLKPIDCPLGVIYIFKNGTLVSWGLKRYQMKIHIEWIKPYVDKPVNFKIIDLFTYRVGDKTSIAPHHYFDVDCIVLEEDSDDLKLGLSYGFSQSIKLQYFETLIDALIEKYLPIIQKLSATGRLSLTHKEMRCVIGEIMDAKSGMNLISNFLYHPKFFWQHPTLEEYYIMLERYLHFQRRVNAINHRLDTLNEIFDMLNSSLEIKHTHFLEIIVIILIATEILFGVLNFHF